MSIPVRSMNIVPEHKLWCVTGQNPEGREFEGGVLTWCYDKHDALHIKDMWEDRGYRNVQALKWTNAGEEEVQRIIGL